MPKDNYYLFDAGVNYRDSVVGVNELKDANNLYWEGSLKRRLGYETKHANLTSPAATTWPSSGIQLIDHVRLQYGSSDYYLAFAYMADTGNATGVLTFFYATTLPTSTAVTMRSVGTSTMTTAEGVGVMIPWATSDPFSAVVMDDKVWLALGDSNPYVVVQSTANSTAWYIHEYPICQYSNNLATGRVDGKNIIPGTTNATNNGDWDGAKMVGAGGGYLYVSDGKTLYWAVSEAGIRADNGATYAAILDRSSGVHTTGTPLSPGWSINSFTGIEEQLDVEKAEAYKKYLFLYGNNGVVSFYLRNLYGNDYDKIVETRSGVYGKIIACDKGVFWVGKDGIYGFDGTSATNLSKKIWPQIESQNSSIPANFEQCSLAFHNGYVWISFPGGTNKEVYVFDPDLIYDDDHGESHAPFYPLTYTNSTGRSAQGFNNLKSYDNHLYGLGCGPSSYWHLYELEAGGKDNETTATGGTYNGISFNMKSAYLDQGAPAQRKIYRQITLETNDDLCDSGTTASMAHVQLAASVDYCTNVNFRGITDTGVIDLSGITSGVGHVLRTIDVPMSSAGYVLDGESISVEIIGNASGSTVTSSGIVTTGNVAIYGFGLTYDILDRPAEEI